MHKIDSGIDTGDIITHVRPKIEDDDDVQSVHSNFDITDEVLAEMA